MAEQKSNAAVSKDEALKRQSNISLIRSLLPIIGLVVVFIIFNILTKGGMLQNLSMVMTQIYVTMIAATGVFFIMTMGGLDFSQGSILGMASIVVCMVSKVAPVPVAVLAGIATGAGIGAINGFFYVNRKIKSFIVTICTMFLFRGIIKYLTSTAPVGANATMILLNKDQLKLTCTLIVVVIGFAAFHFTKFGIHLRR